MGSEKSSNLFRRRKYPLVFLVSSIIAGVLGFGVMAGTPATIAKVCLALSLVFFAFSLLYDRDRKYSEI